MHVRRKPVREHRPGLALPLHLHKTQKQANHNLRRRQTGTRHTARRGRRTPPGAPGKKHQKNTGRSLQHRRRLRKYNLPLRANRNTGHETKIQRLAPRRPESILRRHTKSQKTTGMVPRNNKRTRHRTPRKLDKRQ